MHKTEEIETTEDVIETEEAEASEEVVETEDAAVISDAEEETDNEDTLKTEISFYSAKTYSEDLAWIKFNHDGYTYWGVINRSGELIFALAAVNDICRKAIQTSSLSTMNPLLRIISTCSSYVFAGFKAISVFSPSSGCADMVRSAICQNSSY